jgi:hypothetical protein
MPPDRTYRITNRRNVLRTYKCQPPQGSGDGRNVPYAPWRWFDVTVPPIAQLAAVGVMFVLGYAVERRLDGVGPLVSAPRVARILVVGLALGGPFALLHRGVIADLFGFDASVVALALSLVLYVAADLVVGTGSRDDGNCRTAGRPVGED